jgi:hypothetical protein
MGYADEDEAKHRDLAGLPWLAFVIFFLLVFDLGENSQASSCWGWESFV